MWFEILPSFGIVLAALTIPHIANYWVNKGFTGRPYKRSLDDQPDIYMYIRDARLTGDPYKLNNLNSIPDQ